MTDYLDHLLEELIPAERDAGSWSDVLDRARRSRRRYTALVAVLAALVLAPAAWAAVNAFEGTPAPQVIQQNFSYTPGGHQPNDRRDSGLLPLRTPASRTASCNCRPPTARSTSGRHPKPTEAGPAGSSAGSPT